MSDQDDILRRLEAIERKLDHITERVLSTPHCPSPGLCIQLREAVMENKRMMDHAMDRIVKLEKWQAWITGVGAVCVVGISLFGPAIRRFLNIE